MDGPQFESPRFQEETFIRTRLSSVNSKFSAQKKNGLDGPKFCKLLTLAKTEIIYPKNVGGALIAMNFT